MTQRLPTFFVIGLIYASASGAALPDEAVSTPADQKALAISIYSNNLALVKETRLVRLEREVNKLAWRGVSAQIRPETAQLRHLGNAAGFRLIEQNFEFDLLSPEKLLEKYLGKDVFVIRTHPTTGLETRESATVLSTNGGPVLKFADRIETGVPGRLAFPSVPENMRDKPTLVMSIMNPVAGGQHLELTYLTHGLSWQADYVAELNASEDRMDLNGWVTLTNQSATAYPNAQLQLIAGDVNLVTPTPVLARETLAMSKSADMDQMKPEPLFEYHLYTLARPTSLAENQTKQVALMSALNVPVKKEYVLQGASHYYSGPYPDLGPVSKVGVFVGLQNSGDGLSAPLPKGIVRVYKKDTHGSAQFIGEDRIDHIPKNETVRLKLGDAFDLTADKKQTDFQKLPASGHNSIFESGYQVLLKNAKDEAVTVTVREPISGDWKVVSESLPHSRPTAHTAEWKVRIPPRSSTMLTYRVRVRY